jgi:hypothetical protein
MYELDRQRQLRIDSNLYPTQTSKQPKISNALLRDIKDCKTYLSRVWTK